MIYPERFEHKIEFDKIRQMLKDSCLSTLGQKIINDLIFLADYEELHILLNQTDEFKQICLFEENFPVSYYFDVTEPLNKKSVEGQFLEGESILNFYSELLRKYKIFCNNFVVKTSYYRKY